MIANLIQNVPAWETATAAQIANAINAKTIEVVDQQLYTWAGVALVVGPQGAEAFRLALEGNGMGWVVHQLGGSGIQLSNPLVQQALLGFVQKEVPGADLLAATGKKLVSMAEQAGLQDVSTADVQAGLLVLRKAKLEDIAMDRLHAYREALSAWDGSGEEPVL